MAACVTDTVTLWSRQGKDLTRYFRDLAEAMSEQVPPGCIIDGDALIWTGDRLDFTTLQARMTTGKKALSAFVREHPPRSPPSTSWPRPATIPWPWPTDGPCWRSSSPARNRP